MSKRVIAFIALASVAVIYILLIFMKFSAGIAHKKTDDIMQQFKTVERDFNTKTTKPHSLNKIKMEMDSLFKGNK